MSKKIAVYVRVSTEKDEQISSVENQIDICRNWLERQGFEWDENCIYKDHGISGTFFLERPAIQQILQQAKKKEIDMVIFKSISRLARDLKDSLEIREVFIAHHVRIISVEEGYDSHKAGKNDMAFELWSLFSAQYSRTLSAGVSAALAAKVRRGEHIGRIPYGFVRIDGKLQILEEEAKVAQMIFRWYNQGWGFKRITKELNFLGIPSKQGNQWQMTSIQRLIGNPIYCGDFILNQYTSIKVSGRKKQIRNTPEQWIWFREQHPAIITREEWEQANPNLTNKDKRKFTPWNDLRSILKCGMCGSSMVILQSHKVLSTGEKNYYRYLKCSRYRRIGSTGCVNHKPITYEEMKSFIRNRLIEKGRLLELHFVHYPSSDYEKKRREFEKSFQSVQTKSQQLLDLYLDQFITKDEFEAKRIELDRNAHYLQKQINLFQQENHRIREVRRVQEAFDTMEEQGQSLLHVFKTLVEVVILHPNLEVDIVYRFECP
ncbi:DNA invertase Pin-like site-specific DNA recombinase [Croceifilum oryzae]|uniref:DNA invertase Pin-like site-specific DNA recombinase n=1 Tax=Croceifilum oryzae TaxID=1553429 RepID=A0AAJ1WS05_9BACL|nr:recombinase family protein [Croceifilum oryzae]MDQ0417160.1 DNA invertase Pin-like site-specific DNA recombinase [Croceifilum oryzae]